MCARSLQAYNLQASSRIQLCIWNSIFFFCFYWNKHASEHSWSWQCAHLINKHINLCLFISWIYSVVSLSCRFLFFILLLLFCKLRRFMEQELVFCRLLWMHCNLFSDSRSNVRWFGFLFRFFGEFSSHF